MSAEPSSGPSPVDIPWTAVPCKSQGLVTRTIADETVVVPVRGRLAQLQNIHVLTPVGAHLWAQIDGTKDLGTLHASILAAYEVDAEQAREDLLEFLHSLLAAGLVELAGGSSGEAR